MQVEQNNNKQIFLLIKDSIDSISDDRVIKTNIPVNSEHIADYMLAVAQELNPVKATELQLSPTIFAIISLTTAYSKFFEWADRLSITLALQQLLSRVNTPLCYASLTAIEKNILALCESKYAIEFECFFDK